MALPLRFLMILMIPLAGGAFLCESGSCFIRQALCIDAPSFRKDLFPEWDAGGESVAVPSFGAARGGGWADEDPKDEFRCAEIFGPGDDQEAEPAEYAVFFAFDPGAVSRRPDLCRIPGPERRPALSALGDSLLLSRPPPPFRRFV